jgi:alpha-beta hydrolase superfamily lysophospholipase
MKKEERGILSSDCRHTLHVISWIPEGEVKAVLQIVHGMVEFIDRYDTFARYLCDQGIAVIGHDHLGHGLTAGCDEDLGYFAAEGGAELLIQDMHLVTEAMIQEYPAVPHMIMGHSMGSFCLRKYLTRYGNQVDGAIIMGTGDMALAAVLAGKTMSAGLIRLKGKRYRSEKLTAMVFGGYLKHIENVRTPMDWLTKDTDIVDAYLHNKYNTFRFTAGAYHDFFEILEYVTRETDIEKIPRELPILLVSGKEDPVGSWGAGPAHLAARYEKLGFQNVTLKLYEGDRHEILNETDREQVEEDLGNWILEQC